MQIFNIEECKEKHGVWDPMPELTITSCTLCPLQSRLQVTFTMGTKGSPMPDSTLTLCQSRRYPQSRTLDVALEFETSLPHPLTGDWASDAGKRGHSEKISQLHAGARRERRMLYQTTEAAKINLKVPSGQIGSA